MKKQWLIGSAFILVLGSYLGVRFLNPASPPPRLEFSSIERETLQEETIFVDIRGAIMRPGVYKVLASDRVFQIVQRAGGFHPQANQSSINQAGFLFDGDVIDVLFIGQPENSPSTPTRISLNRADQATLETLPGIGPSTALAIIKYREKTPFKSIEDLMKVPGIGEKTYENLRDQITP